MGDHFGGIGPMSLRDRGIRREASTHSLGRMGEPGMKGQRISAETAQDARKAFANPTGLDRAPNFNNALQDFARGEKDFRPITENLRAMMKYIVQQTPRWIGQVPESLRTLDAVSKFAGGFSQDEQSVMQEEAGRMVAIAGACKVTEADLDSAPVIVSAAPRPATYGTRVLPSVQEARQIAMDLKRPYVAPDSSGQGARWGQGHGLGGHGRAGPNAARSGAALARSGAGAGKKAAWPWQRQQDADAQAADTAEENDGADAGVDGRFAAYSAGDFFESDAAAGGDFAEGDGQFAADADDAAAGAFGIANGCEGGASPAAEGDAGFGPAALL
eukprot:tig00021036_g17273.t1